MCHRLDAVLTVFMMCGSRLGMVQRSSQLCRCPIPVSCKLSDPLKVIPDGLKEGGIQSTRAAHSQYIQLTAWAPPQSTYMKGAMQGLRKHLNPVGVLYFFI